MNNYDDIVISSRIRLARNISGFNFPDKLDRLDANEIIEDIFNLFPKFENYRISELDNLVLNSLKEKHLVSEKIIENHKIGAISLSPDEQICIMINEEEHLREQCILKGFKLNEALDIINEIDDKILDNMDVCYDDELGFLTTCPSNLGTGMRASVMLFLPALCVTNQLQDLLSTLTELGLTVRGNYGEGSESSGFVFQLSNEMTLGLTEQEIIDMVSTATIKLCEKEEEARKILIRQKQDDLMDKIYRAYGILKYAYMISSSEAINLLSQVKFGVCLNLIDCATIETIDNILCDINSNTLMLIAGKALEANERDIFRAEYISSKI